MHDAAHGLVSENKSKNNYFGIVYGTFCLLPFTQWRNSHIQHHFWSGNIEKDPVMAFLVNYPKLTAKKKGILNLIWKSWLPILGIIQNMVFWSLAFKQWKDDKKSKKLIAGILLPVCIWGTILLTTPLRFKLLALAPGLFMYFCAVEIVNLPHHLQMTYFSGDKKLPTWDQHVTARTCVYPKWFAKHFTLNFNYHIEHHMFPDAPWYYLENLHDLVKDSLSSEYQEDIYFDWIKLNKKNDLAIVLYGNNDILPQENIPKKRAA